VDLGSHLIKVVRLRKSADGPQLLGRAAVPMPVDPGRDGVGRPEVAAALAQALEAAGVPEGAGELVTAIGGGRVITRPILMPPIPEKELEAALRWETEQHIPLPVHELIVRHVDMGAAEQEGDVQHRLLLVAVPRKVVEDYCTPFREVNRPLLAIDLHALALWRVFFGLRPEEAPVEAVAVLDIGAAHSELAVVRDRKFRYARSLPRGGEALTEALARTHGLDLAAARRIKEGETAELPEAAAAAEGNRGFPLQVGLTELVREVRRSLDWYQTQNRTHPVERIILSGGGSKPPGLAAYLAEQLGLPVEPGRITVSGASGGDEEMDPAFAVALGLALREVLA
jgi:type IV pilus assembly protein PilM